MSADDNKELKTEQNTQPEAKADPNPVFGNYVTAGTRLEAAATGLNTKAPAGGVTLKQNVREETNDAFGAIGLTEIHGTYGTDGKNHGVSAGVTNVEIYPHGDGKDFAVVGTRADLNMNIAPDGKKTLSGSGHVLVGEHAFVSKGNIPVSGFIGAAVSSDAETTTGTIFANEGIGTSGDSKEAYYLNLNQSLTTTRDANNTEVKVAPDIANFNVSLSTKLFGTEVLGTVNAGVDHRTDPAPGPETGVAVGAGVGMDF